MANVEEIIDKIVQDIWSQYDKDNSGYLDKKESRPFVAQTLVDMGESGDFSEEEFEGCFKEFDKDGNGQISKEEMRDFIKKVAKL